MLFWDMWGMRSFGIPYRNIVCGGERRKQTFLLDRFHRRVTLFKLAFDPTTDLGHLFRPKFPQC